MIVKVQMSLASGDGIRRVLIYDRPRRFQYEGGVNDDVVEMMGDRAKAYFEAGIRDGNLELGPEVEAQSW
ncbi:MAG: hypothetical protein KF894_34125 [Labilithrix sp.]|nr:hypothetical protein [Labilithrix sp.]